MQHVTLKNSLSFRCLCTRSAERTWLKRSQPRQGFVTTASGGFDSTAYKGKAQMKKVLGHMFDTISCFPVDAELALDANCHTYCICAVLG